MEDNEDDEEEDRRSSCSHRQAHISSPGKHTRSFILKGGTDRLCIISGLFQASQQRQSLEEVKVFHL
jgi:hypothetical protein